MLHYLNDDGDDDGDDGDDGDGDDSEMDLNSEFTEEYSETVNEPILSIKKVKKSIKNNTSPENMILLELDTRKY